MDAIAALGIKLKPLIVQIVGFLILLWLLKRFLFGRITEMVQTRSNEIKNAYDENERIRDEVQKLKAAYDQKLQQMQEEAEHIIQDATKKANQLQQEMLEKARQQGTQLREKSLAEIEHEKKKALAEIRNEVVNLSILLTSRLIQKSLDQETAEKLIDDVIGEIGGTPS